MKLLYCEACGDIIAPYRNPLKPRPCYCGRHHVWWENPQLGILRIHDAEASWYDLPNERIGPQRCHRSIYAAWVLGVHNSLLQHPSTRLSAGNIQEILDETPDTYIFKTTGSLIIRIRAGHSNDTAYAEHLPT